MPELACRDGPASNDNVLGSGHVALGRNLNLPHFGVTQRFDVCQERLGLCQYFIVADAGRILYSSGRRRRSGNRRRRVLLLLLLLL